MRGDLPAFYGVPSSPKGPESCLFARVQDFIDIFCPEMQLYLDLYK